MEWLKVIEDKIEQYQRDMKFMIKSSKFIDKIKTARIKKEFEDLISDKIIELGKQINDLKCIVKEEKTRIAGDKLVGGKE